MEHGAWGMGHGAWGMETGESRWLRSILACSLLKNASWPEVITYQISNGNIVKVTIEEGTIEKVITTTSYTFLPNSVNTIGIENKGLVFHGKQDKNLVKEAHTVSSSREPSEFTISYKYEYDAQKRLTKRTTLGGAVNSYETYTYYD